MKYQNLPLPLPPLPSPGVLSRNPISPVTGPFAYVPESPISPKYSPASPNKHSEHLAASYSPRSPSVRRSHRHSLTPSDLPDYCSTYSTHMDSHIPAFASKPTRKDTQYTSYQPPSASKYSPPSPHAQLAALSISSFKNERRLPFQQLPTVPASLNHSSSDSNRGSRRSSRDPHGDSASHSVYSGVSSSSPSTPTSHGTWLPPAPPPSPNFFFPGSRSVARPRVTSKITISQLKKRRSKSRLRAERSQTSLISLSPVSPSVDQAAFETSPVSPVVQTPIKSNHPEVWSDESALMHGDDYHHQPKAAPSAPKTPPETLVFPTSRSRAQPKISSKPKASKRSSRSLKSKDDNSGRLRIIGALFKKKNKGKTLKITPSSKMYSKLSDPVAPTGEHAPPEKRTSEESNHEYTAHQERTRMMKSKSGSYPLDPYNSVLLDKLSRLNIFIYLYIIILKSIFILI